MGYSRQQFYTIRRNYQPYGSSGLWDKLPGCKGEPPPPIGGRLKSSKPF